MVLVCESAFSCEGVFESMGRDSDWENKVVAIIGCGNMGAALMRGFAQAKSGMRSRFIGLDSEKSRVDSLVREAGIEPASAYADLSAADVVIVAVKPSSVDMVLEPLRRVVCEGEKKRIVVSIAAGVSLPYIREKLDGYDAVVRVMPNLPCEVGAGMCGLYAESDDLARIVAGLFSHVGRVIVFGSERELDTVTGIAGSGPAFVFAFAEAMTEGGVNLGIPRSQALKLAVQTLKGAAEMLLVEGAHPSLLRERVTSPGGTTIAGLLELEKGGFRGLVMSALQAAASKAGELKR